MLSYRHAYHAGGPADVLKHAVYAWCLDYLTRKPKPFFIMDTHAGAGVYDLFSGMAEKTGEWRRGVRMLWPLDDAPELFSPWSAVLKGLNPGGDLEQYPGSPEIAARIRREGDRLRLCELHPTDHAAVEAMDGIVVTQSDGFETLVKLMPPKERRGIALIDPSYEIKDDYDRAVEAISAAYRRFATGVYLLWYPVVDRELTEPMIEAVAARAGGDVLRIELGERADTTERGMTASGLVVINPPWGLEQAARAGLSWLAERLGVTGRSFVERPASG